MAFAEELPEMDHNEILGYEHQHGAFHLIFLNSDAEHYRIKKRIKITKSLLREEVEITELGIKGTCLLAELFTAVYLGDLTSYYVAIMNGVDPTPVEFIEKLKQEMGPFL